MKILSYSAILLALFLVALAPAAAADVLYAGNFGYPGGIIYPTLAADADTVTVEMYNAGYTGPSDDLLAYAWKTVDPTNYSDVEYDFNDFDIVFYDMGEFWYYPFGNYDENGNLIGSGAYERAGNNNTTFVALRSSWGFSNLANYPFAIIDDPATTATGSFYQAYNDKPYLLGFFTAGFYDVTDPYFIGTAGQADAFVEYVLDI